MKKKLMQWKSKSQSGLKGLSSYLLKTTLLWLCEILPEDECWLKDELANRYFNFLQELEHRLKMKRIGEYFNPSVNLLENKNEDTIEELRQFVVDEIDDTKCPVDEENRSLAMPEEQNKKNDSPLFYSEECLCRSHISLFKQTDTSAASEEQNRDPAKPVSCKTKPVDIIRDQRKVVNNYCKNTTPEQVKITPEHCTAGSRETKGKRNIHASPTLDVVRKSLPGSDQSDSGSDMVNVITATNFHKAVTSLSREYLFSDAHAHELPPDVVVSEDLCNRFVHSQVNNDMLVCQQTKYLTYKETSTTMESAEKSPGEYHEVIGDYDMLIHKERRSQTPVKSLSTSEEQNGLKTETNFSELRNEVLAQTSSCGWSDASEIKHATSFDSPVWSAVRYTATSEKPDLSINREVAPLNYLNKWKYKHEHSDTDEDADQANTSVDTTCTKAQNTDIKQNDFSYIFQNEFTTVEENHLPRNISSQYETTWHRKSSNNSKNAVNRYKHRKKHRSRFETEPRVWKPVIRKSSIRHNKRRYNSHRRRLYTDTQLDHAKFDSILAFYEEKVKVDNNSKTETQEYINGILTQILNNKANRGRFSRQPDEEGSVAVGVKVGKADESDHSVDIQVNDKNIELSDKPFNVEYEDDDIDSNSKDEVSTKFVDSGKRLFPEEERLLHNTQTPTDIPDGYIAAKIGKTDAARFSSCCISRHFRSPKGTWFLPYPLIRRFHMFVGKAVDGLENVTLNKGASGPAVTLTIRQEDGPNISVDITLKLTLPCETLSVKDFSWPRRDTRKWLSEEKIESILSENIYLVPKGDKYWKISFAKCECELLRDIDDSRTWRKGCLRIMKKKLMQWKSKSQSGLKGLSSYLLKTTLLWLCEILPEDECWLKDELANRYLNFLQEFEHRLKMKSIGEYFNPSVNLLENKNEDTIEELRQFVAEEIDELTE